MKVYQTNEIKNIALLGSAGSGKTTLAEAMVYEAGIIRNMATRCSLLFFMWSGITKNSISLTVQVQTTS